MPHVTEHTPKVSTPLVKPYACESSREKRQQDRQTDRRTNRQTHRRIVQNHFSRRFGCCTSRIRSYLEVDFLHDANTSIDMEVKTQNHKRLQISFIPFHARVPPQRYFLSVFFKMIGPLFMHTRRAKTRHSQNRFTRLSYKRVHESPQKLVRRNAPCNRT